jgi:hypothetical protein
MLDTNIYLDMIVARNQSNNANSYEQFIKLLNYGQVGLIVPKIVETEVLRHIDDEIDKIGIFLKETKKRIKMLYWINDKQSLEQFQEMLKPVRAGVNHLNNEFSQGINQFKKRSKTIMDKVFRNHSTLIINETNEIMFNAMQRRLHKRRPFHYGKDENKDCLADSVIIETLINIKDLMNFHEDDEIFFISRNIEEFSKSKLSTEKSLFHEDIIRSLEKKEILNNVQYRIHFTQSLLDDFTAETENAGIKEELERELVQESLDMQIDESREAGGLGPLSDDHYVQRINDSQEMTELVDRLEAIKIDIDDEYNQYVEDYNDLIEKLDGKNYSDMQNITRYFNAHRDQTIPAIDISDCLNEDDIKEKFELVIFKYFCDPDEIELDDRVNVKDYYELNDTLARFLINNENYEIRTEGNLNPENAGADNIDIALYKNSNRIEAGSINIEYGYLNFNDNGNADDGQSDSIDIQVDEILERLDEIKEKMLNIVNHESFGSLNKFIQMFGPI